MRLQKTSRSLEAPWGDTSLRQGQLHPKHFACQMWNEEQRGGKLFKRVWEAQAETGPATLCFGPSETVACNASRFSCRLQKIPLSQHTCRTGAKERQGVQKEGGWSTSKHMGVWVQREQSYTVWCYFWDLTSFELTSLNQVMMVKPLFRMIFHMSFYQDVENLKRLLLENVWTQKDVIPFYTGAIMSIAFVYW